MSNKGNTGGEGFIVALIVMAIAGALKASGRKVSWWWILLPIPAYIIGMLLLSGFVIGAGMLVRGG